MVAAGFTGGEAEELRRAMGFKRSSERMAVIETRLRSGMTERGITGEASLAHAGAFATLPDAATGERGLSRCTALWQAASAARDLGPLYDTLEDDVASPLPEMSRFEETVADYQTSELTAGPHLIAHFRAQLKKDGTLSIRAERFERMSLEEPIPALRKPVSPPYPRHRDGTPPSHDFR